MIVGEDAKQLQQVAQVWILTLELVLTRPQHYSLGQLGPAGARHPSSHMGLLCDSFSSFLDHPLARNKNEKHFCAFLLMPYNMILGSLRIFGGSWWASPVSDLTVSFTYSNTPRGLVKPNIKFW